MEEEVDKDIVNGHRTLSRKLSKSTSDISTHEGSRDDSAQGTPSASPMHRPSAYARRRGIQFGGWWTTLKKFAPQRLSRSRSKDRKQISRKKEAAEEPSLRNSHPDVSRANSTDAYAGDNSSEQEPSRSATPSLSPSPKRMLRVEAASFSDPNLIRRHSSESDAHKSLSQSDGVESKETKGKEELCETLARTDSLEASVLRHRQVLLRQHAFFELSVHLRQGRDLVARDSCGTSDPYVKFKVGGRLLYKSKTINKTLNPEWDEHFTLAIEDVFQPIHIKVFDYDWGLQDDFMGSAYLDLTTLEPNKVTNMTLTLMEPGKTDYMGELHLTVTLIPRTQEEKEQKDNETQKSHSKLEFPFQQ